MLARKLKSFFKSLAGRTHTYTEVSITPKVQLASTSHRIQNFKDLQSLLGLPLLNAWKSQGVYL